mmetsp:Transcript_5748/g.16132  ORF Transcript_5748/g.16132 Transcript_5748/m.16132 type:complete len:85 (+) Transcript_5748:420-674(+)
MFPDDFFCIKRFRHEVRRSNFNKQGDLDTYSLKASLVSTLFFDSHASTPHLHGWNVGCPNVHALQFLCEVPCVLWSCVMQHLQE